MEKSRYNNLLQTLVLITYLIYTTYFLLEHVMWRDELHAWLIARESSNLNELINNSKYEGRFPLYHLIILPLTKLSINPESIKILTLVFTCLFLFILIYKIKIDLIYKIMLFG